MLLIVGGVAYAVLERLRRRRRQGKQRQAGGAKVKPSEIEVTVLNGTAVAGLAATYGDKVEGKGFKLGAVTNTQLQLRRQRRHVQARPQAGSAARSPSSWGSRKMELMSSEIAIRRRRGECRGDRRRGQCRGGGLTRRALVVFALLVLATLAAFAWAQRLKRDPLVLDRVTFVGAPVLHPKNAGPQLHPERRLPL